LARPPVRRVTPRLVCQGVHLCTTAVIPPQKTNSDGSPFDSMFRYGTLNSEASTPARPARSIRSFDASIHAYPAEASILTGRPTWGVVLVHLAEARRLFRRLRILVGTPGSACPPLRSLPTALSVRLHLVTRRYALGASGTTPAHCLSAPGFRCRAIGVGGIAAGRLVTCRPLVGACFVLLRVVARSIIAS
jgi:hypothetical protein